MFLLKSLYGKVWSDTSSTELAQISTGQLFLVRPESIQGSRECLFNNAMITIRRSTQEFNFQLVATRVFEEGEEQLLDEDEETEDERSFLISDELQFRVGTFEGEPAFRWRDLQGDPNDIYEFVAYGTNDATSSFFENCMYKAMWERKHNRSAADATENQLRQFVYKEEIKPSKVSSKKSRVASGSSTKAVSAQIEEAPPVKALVKPQPEIGTPQGPASGNAVYSTAADLFVWNMEDRQFEFQGTGEASLIQKGDWEYAVIVKQEDLNVLFHIVSPDMNPSFSDEHDSFTWNNINRQEVQTSWALQFYKKEDLAQWREAFAQALYETLHQTGWNKAKPDEQAYIMSAYKEDVVMKDADADASDEEDEVQKNLPVRAESDESEDEEDEVASSLVPAKVRQDDSSDEEPSFPAGKNEQLTVGFNKDRSYVVRGDKIGVFKATSEGKMEHHGTLSQVKNTKGKAFKPERMMLHDQDTTMIIMDPGEKHSLFKMDIERGKIVEEWRVDDNVPVLHMAPESKFAQTQPERTILGASGNALFRIDPRLSGNKLVDSEFKQYVSKNKFSGLSTTEAGKVVVASEKGDLRLFDKVGKNAKTALPAMGDPIVGVDVTKDGRWIVATCKTYLLVVDTLIGEGRYSGQLGFDRSFPADAKPIPRRLKLKNPHVQYMGGQVSFSPARFNMGEGQDEATIVTSTGNYVIAWDFKAVKKGKLDKYEIRKYADVVVQDQFRYGDPNDIVVALQNNVVMVNKKHLKSPGDAKSYGRKSLGGTSKSAIVDSPY